MECKRYYEPHFQIYTESSLHKNIDDVEICRTKYKIIRKDSVFLKLYLTELSREKNY